LKEVYSTDKEKQTVAPVIALFDEEEDDNRVQVDEEVQMQLNSLIPPWEKSGGDISGIDWVG
jgi:hypothetical protein